MGFSYPKNQKGGESNAVKNGLFVAKNTDESYEKLLQRSQKNGAG